jgi:hypothetical protein
LSGDNSGSEEIANIRERSRYTRKCKTFLKEHAVFVFNPQVITRL